MRIFCVVLHLFVFLISHIQALYRHSCIVYLQGMRPMGVFIWLLVSQVAYLESLHGQSSIAFAP